MATCESKESKCHTFQNFSAGWLWKGAILHSLRGFHLEEFTSETPMVPYGAPCHFGCLFMRPRSSKRQLLACPWMTSRRSCPSARHWSLRIPAHSVWCMIQIYINQKIHFWADVKKKTLKSGLQFFSFWGKHRSLSCAKHESKLPRSLKNRLVMAHHGLSV